MSTLIMLLTLAGCADPVSPSTVKTDDTHPADSGARDSESADSTTDTSTNDSAGNDAPIEIIDVRGAPSVAIVTPTAAGAWNATSATLDLSGIASPDARTVHWSTDAGDSGPATGTTEWNARIPLPEGITKLTVTATDADGDDGSAEVLASWQPRGSIIVSTTTRVAEPGALLALTANVTTADTVSVVNASVVCATGTTTTTLTLAGSTWGGTVLAPADTGDCALWAVATTEHGTLTSLPAVIRVRERPDAARIAEILATGDAIQAILTAGGSVDDALASLVARTDITKAGAGDRGVWWITSEGVLLSAAMDVPGDKSGGGPGTIPDRTLWAYHPYTDQFSPNDEVPNYLIPKAPDVACPLTVKEYTDSTSSVGSFLLPNGGLIHVSTHGDTMAPGACTLPASRAETPAVGDYYCPAGWSPGGTTGEVAYNSREFVDDVFISNNWDALTAWDIAVADNVAGKFAALLPGQISFNYSGTPLDGAVVVLSSCRSARNATMAQAYLDAGAQAVIGFTDYVGAGYANAFSQAFYEAWWFNGDSLNDAYEAGWAAVGRQPDDTRDPAEPMLFTNVTVPTMGGLVVNGNFEDGNDGWSFYKDASVTSAVLGTWGADDGGDFGLLFVGNQFVAYFYQALALSEVDAGADYRLRFDWRIVTDAGNWYGNPSDRYTPWFVARIDSPDGNSILYENDPSVYDEYLTDGGGTGYYISGWQSESISWTADADYSSPTVIFHAGTDHWDDHYVMIDNIEFIECSE